MNGIELSEQQELLGTLDLVRSVDQLRLSLGFDSVSTLTPIVELKLRHGLLPARDLVLICSPWDKKTRLTATKRAEAQVNEEEEAPELLSEDEDFWDDEDDEDEDDQEEAEAEEQEETAEAETSEPLEESEAQPVQDKDALAFSASWSIKMTFPLGFPHKKPCSFTVLTPAQARLEPQPQPLAVIEEDWDALEEEDLDAEDDDEDFEDEDDAEEEEEKDTVLAEAQRIQHLLNSLAQTRSSESAPYPLPLAVLEALKPHLVFDGQAEPQEGSNPADVTEETDGVSSNHRFTCRLCRHLLFTSAELSDHTSAFLADAEAYAQTEGAAGQLRSRPKKGGKQAKPCTSYFLEDAPAFLTPEDLNSEEGGGRLLCPKCQARCGSWAWVGSACSCGEWIAPSFQFTISKVDKI